MRGRRPASLAAGWFAVAAVGGGCSIPAVLPLAELPTCQELSDSPGSGDLRRIRLEAASARCNDGSAPSLLARAATDPAHERDWVIQLQGGANCSRRAQCQDRWCDQPWLMSSEGGPDRRPGTGILEPSQRNPFGGWNAVQLHYCTSDHWLGDGRGPVTLEGWIGGLELTFSGHAVLLAALEALDAGLELDGEVLPRLVDAERVVWTGFSAGGDGAAHHLDLVAARYPRAQVVGLIDAYLQPDPARFEGPSRAAAEAFAEEWERVHAEVWGRFGPTPCDGGRCQSGTFLWTERVKTPAVLHLDLADPGISQLYTQRGASLAAFSLAAERTLRDLAARAPTTLSVLGTHCGRHVVTTDEALFELSVADAVAGGPPTTLPDAVLGRFGGAPRAIAVDAVPGRTSRCPSPRPAGRPEG